MEQQLMAGRSARAFTLSELMITVVILGILAAVAIPNYQRMVERQYWQQAGDMLLTIYTGERAFFLLNNSTYLDVNEADNNSWRQINMDNPNLGGIPITYTVGPVDNGANPRTFTATATRNGGPCDNQFRTINQARVLTAGVCWGACCP